MKTSCTYYSHGACYSPLICTPACVGTMCYRYLEKELENVTERVDLSFLDTLEYAEGSRERMIEWRERL